MGAVPDAIRRNVAFSFAAQLTSAAFTAALVLLLARELGPEGYGLFAVALGMGMLAQLFVDLGLGTSTARFVAERRGDDDAVVAVIADALRVKALLSVGLSGLIVALAGPIASAYGEPDLAWPLRGISVAILGQSFFAFFNSMFIGLGRTSLQLRNYVSESAIEFTASLALVLAGAGVTGAAFGRAAGYVAGAAIGGWLLGRLFGGRLRAAVRRDHGMARTVLVYAGPLFVVDAAFVAFEQVDVLIAGALLGAEDAGVLQAPLRLMTFMFLIGGAVASGVAPRQTAAREHRDPGAFVAALRGLTVIYLIAAAGVLVWSTPLIDLALGGEFEESADVLRAFAPYVFLGGLGPLAGVTASYLGLAGLRVPITAGTLLVNIVLDLILIPEMGVTGAAVGTSVAYAGYLVAHLVIVGRELRVDLRPLGLTVLRGGLAAGALAGILAAFGTGPLGAGTMVAGALCALLAAAGVLVVTRELDPRAARAWVRRRRA